MKTQRRPNGEYYHQWLALCAGGHQDKDKCLIFPYANRHDRKGYINIYIRGKNVGAHRYMCELAHGPAPVGKPMALHTCGNGHSGCVNPHHLRWGNHIENMADMHEHGHTAIGTNHGRAKLTDEKVRKIRALRGQGMTLNAIAGKFGVSRPTIKNVLVGKIWRHVE